eukprot:scaffold75382_cov34-Tisochrysis_lutea.AAC.3
MGRQTSARKKNEMVAQEGLHGVGHPCKRSRLLIGMMTRVHFWTRKVSQGAELTIQECSSCLASLVSNAQANLALHAL